jgi:outer membrane lipase/esterase
MISGLTRVLRGTLCAMLFGPALSMEASAFGSLTILGDSLSDSGNFAAVYGGAIDGGLIGPATFPPAIPSAACFPGTFSNGPNYSVTLADALGLQANPSVLGGTNYAFGAARTGYHGLQTSSPEFRGLVQQRDKLLADRPLLDASGLYIVFGGGNNVQDILTSALTGSAPLTSVPATVADIGSIVDDLFTHGAGTVMVANLPELGLVPRIAALGSAAVGAARSLGIGINAGIAGKVAKQESLGRSIIAFDVFSLFNDLIANPGSA